MLLLLAFSQGAKQLYVLSLVGYNIQAGRLLNLRATSKVVNLPKKEFENSACQETQWRHRPPLRLLMTMKHYSNAVLMFFQQILNSEVKIEAVKLLAE